jgi:putative transcriptional regulator
MTVQHHPSDELLCAYAAGSLDVGQHVAVATHLVSCLACRTFIREMEVVGGLVLAGLPETAMAEDALKRARARLGEKAPSARAHARRVSAADVPGLPAFVRSYRFGSWQWIAPKVHMRPIVLPLESPTRVFLLRSGPGMRMLQHTHTDLELTCVLSGAFSHAGGRYGPGDFDLGDDTVEHQPIVEPGEPCVCLVAMQGNLQFKGLIGRVMQPFVRL